MYSQLAVVLIGIGLLLWGWAFVKSRRGEEPVPPVVAEPASTKPADTPPAPPEEEEERRVMVVATRPIGVEDDESMDYARSEITSDLDLGSARAIVFDEGSDIEEVDPLRVVLQGAVGLSHQGRRRKDNQDRFVVLESHHLFVVADGMGGYAGGQVAAQLAVDTIRSAFEADDFFGGPMPEVPRSGSQLAAAIQMANRAIWKEANRNADLQQMGTTVVAARFSPDRNRLYIGHVGDSRCYRWRSGQLEQITSDHTMKNQGLEGPLADHLTRAVGISPSVEVDIILVKPRPGDSYLLCSDGLNKMVPDDEIAEILGTAANTEIAVDALIQRANARGGRDNITCVLVRAVDPSPPAMASPFGASFLSQSVDDEDEMPTVLDSTRSFSLDD